jgi:hypothetical protein
MVTDAQVRLLRRQMSNGKTVTAAAACAGMSERSAHTWKCGPLPSESRDVRHWRTRKDPFEAVWESDVVPMLRADEDGALQGTTILEELQRRHGSAYGPALLRTLQRRMHEWRALHGAGKEVRFEQRHEAGREAAFDFTDMGSLGITLAGVAFPHLLFQLVLSFSKWRWFGIAFSESFEAMLRGLQGALWALGGVPAVLRSDNMSAATHRPKVGARELNPRYRAVLDHYGTTSTRIEPGESHQNGVVEKAHDVLKTAIDQALILRASRDFPDLPAYEAFLGKIGERLLQRVAADRLALERAHLRPLPSSKMPDYTAFEAHVRGWSTVHFGGRTYSVPSRLIGCTVQVRQYAELVEVWYRGVLTASMPRARGPLQYHRIDYRHVIWSLVRKPGAFARYKYREELFPSLVFRRAYDSLVAIKPERADAEYVRILHLAASTMEATVEAALEQLLEQEVPLDYMAVKQLAQPEKPTVPLLNIPAPDPADYDVLLVGGAQ